MCDANSSKLLRNTDKNVNQKRRESWESSLYYAIPSNIASNETWQTTKIKISPTYILTLRLNATNSWGSKG